MQNNFGSSSLKTVSAFLLSSNWVRSIYIQIMQLIIGVGGLLFKLEKQRSKISYVRIFMFLGGIMTIVFGLIAAFIPGLCFAWIAQNPWYYHDYEWHIEYLSMQPQIYVLTPWRLIASIGGVFGIISMLKDDVRFLRLGFLGILLGIIGLFSAPFRYSPESAFLVLPLPAYSLTFLGVAIMLTSLMYKFGSWYRLAFFIIPLIGSYYLLYPLAVTFDLQLYASLFDYRSPTTTWLSLFFMLGYILVFLGCIVCLLKTFKSSFTIHRLTLNNSDANG